jgi:hypothetical protein
MVATTTLFENAGVLDAASTRQVMVRTRLGGYAPLYTALLSAGRTASEARGTIHWYDRELSSQRTQINNASDDYDAATTAIVVDSAAGSARAT